MKLKLRFFVPLLILIMTGAVAVAWSHPANDNWSNTHAPANYRVEKVFEGSGFQIHQFYLGVLAHYSYLLISDNKVLVVDPGRDVGIYLKFAKDNNLDWVGTLLTHTHADFVAGHREMAVYTGAPIFASHKSDALFPYVEIKEGQKIPVGSAMIKIIETPGHTLDSICAIVSGSSATKKPEFLFSGDTVFVGSLGRPDLMGGSIAAGELAEMMFNSWFDKLSLLSDNVVILPAHGAGSLCGSHLSDKSFSTIQQEKIDNPYLKFGRNKSAFISALIKNLLPAPPYFPENVKMNRAGPELIRQQHHAGEKVAIEAIGKEKFSIVDVRGLKEYTAGHIRGSLNISLAGKYEQWLGTAVPFHARLVLTGDTPDVEEAARRGRRTGYESSFLSLNEYLDEGRTLVATKVFSVADYLEAFNKGTLPLIIDVREAGEFAELSLENSLNVAFSALESRIRGIAGLRQQLMVVCSTSYRSVIAVGILERLGYQNISILEGGIEAIVASQPQLFVSVSEKQATPDKKFIVPDVRMLTVTELQQKMQSPDSIAIIDLRGKESFSDYSIAGAIQMDPEDLRISDLVTSDKKEIVLVDGNGNSALVTAAAISIAISRPVYVLQGGLLAFWRQTEKKLAVPSPAVSDTDNKEIESEEKEDLNNKGGSPDKKNKGAGC